MVQDPLSGNVTPKVVGGFNIPKAVIENKVDTLAFLEILVRKEIITTEELDLIRAAVVAHLNQLYPELALSYTTPESLATQAPLPPELTTPSISPKEEVVQEPSKLSPKPLYYEAPRPKFIN